MIQLWRSQQGLTTSSGAAVGTSTSQQEGHGLDWASAILWHSSHVLPASLQFPFGYFLPQSKHMKVGLKVRCLSVCVYPASHTMTSGISSDICEEWMNGKTNIKHENLQHAVWNVAWANMCLWVLSGAKQNKRRQHNWAKRLQGSREGAMGGVA